MGISLPRPGLIPAIFLLLGLAVVPGCELLQGREDIERFERAGTIAGSVESKKGPIVVVLFDADDGKPWDYGVYLESDDYFFAVDPGRYYVAAFYDRGEDGKFQVGEPAGYYGAPDVLDVAVGEHLTGIDIDVPDVAGRFRAGPLGPRFDPYDTELGLSRPPAGQVVPIDSPLFSLETGRLGLWQPLKFLEDVRGGLLFLEEFDPERDVVLFVHGLGGAPVQFATLHQRLKDRYQGWVYQYPSGAPLEFVVEDLNWQINDARSRFPVGRVHVLAHSMGGLVSRGLVLRHNAPIASLTSLSTPWGGIQAAAEGVRDSPIVLPVWRDLVPGGAFHQAIFSESLPEETPFLMIFTYSDVRDLPGRALTSGFKTTPSDGTVQLRSQLYPEAQEQAATLIGLEATHTGVLEDAGVARRVETFLDSASAERR